MTELPQASVLVRTWFGDNAAWDSLVSEVETPSSDGFLAYVTVVNDQAFNGMVAEGLVARQTNGAIVSFLADETTLTNRDHPILAVWVLPPSEDEDEPDHPPFRVVASQLWAVENNINIGNMDWYDFARSLDAEGVFRGF